MARARKLAAGLLVLAWIALAAALVGVFFIPRNYCNELPTPTGQVVTVVGLIVAVGAAVLASFIESARDAPLRESLVALLITGVTVAGVIGVWVLEAHRTASWGCG